MIVRHLNWLFICIVYILVTLHTLLLSNVFNLLVMEHFYSMIVLLLFEYSDTSGVDIVAIRSSRSSLDVFLWSFLMNQSKTTNMLNLSTVSKLNVVTPACSIILTPSNSNVILSRLTRMARWTQRSKLWRPGRMKSWENCTSWKRPWRAWPKRWPPQMPIWTWQSAAASQRAPAPQLLKGSQTWTLYWERWESWEQYQCALEMHLQFASVS